MKYLTRYLAICFVLGITLVTVCLRLKAQSSQFAVTSPTDGQVVNAGGTVQLLLTAAQGRTITDVQVWSPIGNYVQHTGAPLTLSIPNNLIGQVSLLIWAQTSDGSQAEVTRRLQITTNQTLNAVTISPSIVRLVAPGTTVNGLLNAHLTVTGVFSDGVSRDLSTAPALILNSDNATVATVDPSGVVKALAPGQASISATVGSIIGNARVQVNVFELKGDLDGDSDVDQDDLNILLKAMNTNATGPGDPRDLNNDGRIDALDARILVTLCSRLGCATK